MTEKALGIGKRRKITQAQWRLAEIYSLIYERKSKTKMWYPGPTLMASRIASNPHIGTRKF